MSSNLIIKDREDYKQKLRIVYNKWKEHGFSQEWLKNLDERWSPDSITWNFIELIKAKKNLSEEEYKIKEEKVFNTFDEIQEMMDQAYLICKAEKEAFEKAGIEEGTVEYTCPICGHKATATRYKIDGSYQGFGSGCPNCGIILS